MQINKNNNKKKRQQEEDIPDDLVEEDIKTKRDLEQVI
jgi:hypothetical protein